MTTAAGFVAKSAVLLAKTETETGTDPTPTISANAVVAYDVVLNPLGNAETNPRNPIAGDAFLGRQTSVPGKGHATMSFKIPMAGTGVALSSSGVGIPEWSPLLKACAFTETFTANTSVTYADQATTTTCTVYFYVGPAQTTGTNWKLYESNGVAGNVRFVGENGKPVMMEFEMVGTYVAPIDASDPGDPTLIEVIPAPLLSAGFVLNIGSSYDPVVTGFTYDPANVTPMREDINQTLGYRGALITDRDPKLTFQAEEELAANFDWWALRAAGTAGTAATGTIGSTTGNKFSFSWPRINIDSVSDAEREGIKAVDVECVAAMDLSDLTTKACTITIT